MFFRLGAGRSAELKGGKNISMFDRVHMGRVPIQALADHPTHFAMIVHPTAQEFRPGIKDEVTLHFFIYILKLVMIAPYVIACPGNDILARRWNKSSRSGLDIGAYVPMPVKDSHLLSHALAGGQGKKKSKQVKGVYSI